MRSAGDGTFKIKKTMAEEIINTRDVKDKVIVLRGQNVLLDRDETKIKHKIIRNQE